MRKIVPIVFFPLLLLFIALIPTLFSIDIFAVSASVESVQSWVERYAAYAPLAFIFIQLLQVVIFIIPGEITQIAGGFLFGVAYGTLFSIIGILLGKMISYGIGYIFGKQSIISLFRAERYQKLYTLLQSPKAHLAIFLIFLIPGIPKDLFTYVAGAFRIRFVDFLLLSMSGRIPAIIGSAYVGALVQRQQWIGALIVVIVVVLIIGMSVIFRNRLLAWVHVVSNKMRKK